jgi:hypothetical protein
LQAGTLQFAHVGFRLRTEPLGDSEANNKGIFETLLLVKFEKCILIFIAHLF